MHHTFKSNICTKNIPAFILFIITLLFSASSFASMDMRIAVLDFNANNVSKYIAKAVAEIISTEIAMKKDLTIIERSQMGAILQEQGLQMSGCTDSSCAVKIGKLLSARKILIGTLSKVGRIYSISARVVDVETGKVEFAESERCANEDDIESASRILSIKLLNRITGKGYSLPSRTYEVDEERKRFSIGAGFRYGWIRGINYPAMGKSGVNEEKVNGKMKTIVVTPAYEFSNYISVKLNMKYYTIEHDGFSNEQIEGTYGTPDSFVVSYDSEGRANKFKGYGLNTNIQLNYPIRGFIPFASIGFGYSQYKVQSIDSIFVYHPLNFDSSGSNDGYIYQGYKFNLSYEKIKAFTSEIELGLAIYVSRYFEIVLIAGIELPLFAKIYDGVMIDKGDDSETGNTDNIPVDKQSYQEELDKDDFEGNFPPIYFIQAGVNFRVF